MIIKAVEEGATKIVHALGEFKVVKGLADVPNAIGEELIKFPHWNITNEMIDEDTLKELKQEEDVKKVK